MLLPIGKDRIRAPKPTTAEAEWITNTIINQMRKRDGY
jgi:hypothetical protein